MNLDLCVLNLEVVHIEAAISLFISRFRGLKAGLGQFFFIPICL
ncbi:hypothetical protein RchiOBHm_Chr2g0159981 [Rosa chinensis]|uniref:Uncharacterized protein n=1 Tax=Rosa chinensis TaxID=74649 RepID=A0A2P6S2G7_ROSCH|nr:hypothetical protein RchiOBHm_Chr2g0159981 [Rosa chinensis]